MPSFCCVINCGSTRIRDNVRFFRIPAILSFKHKTNLNELSAKRRQKWLNAIKRGDFPGNKQKNAAVCSRHFISGKPSELTDELNPDWAPSVNMGHHKTLTAKRMERFERKRPVSTNANETEKENVIRDEKFMKMNMSSGFTRNSINNSKLVENLYKLSPQVEIHIKSSDEDEDELITSTSVEECVAIEVSDTNNTSPATENYINGGVIEVSDTNNISPISENYINDSEDEVDEPTNDPIEETGECLSESSTLTALSEDPFASDNPSDNPSDTEEAANVPSSVPPIVSKTHLAFQDKVAKRRPFRYFGDCSADDLNNPTRAKTSWHIAKRTISEQKAKIRRIQTQNRRLRAKIGNLNSLLTYLFHNYEFEKKS